MHALFTKYDREGNGSIAKADLVKLLEDVSKREESIPQRPDIKRPIVDSTAEINEEEEQQQDDKPRGIMMEVASPPPSPPTATSAQTAARQRPRGLTSRLDRAITAPTSEARISVSVQPSRTFSFAWRSSWARKMGTQSLRREMDKVAQELLDKSQLWSLKTHFIFPVVAQLRFLDHVSRIVFPTVYIIYLLVHLSKVNFGVDHRQLLESTVCYGKQ